MTKVYVVTTGSYSDYGINGIFSTEELAQKWIDANMNSSDGWHRDFNPIIEYTVDNPSQIDPVEKTQYSVAIDANTGDVVPGRTWENKEVIGSSIRSGTVKVYTISKNSHSYPNATHIVAESYESMEHAIKLAAEKRQELLRAKATGLDAQ